MKNLQLFIVASLCAALITSCKKDIKSSQTNSTSLSANETIARDYAETLPPVQLPVTVNINSNIGGYLEALPADYALHPNKKYPLILFIHGMAERGNGTTAELLKEVTQNSIPHLISIGTFPANFVSNNHNYSFIVISPQFKEWAQPSDINTMLNYVINKYRIDTTMIYLTGDSMGGGATWETAWSAYGKRFAAILPMAGASYPTPQKGQMIAAAKIAVWAFHNNTDPTVPAWYSIDYIQYINDYSPVKPAKLTLYPSGGHNCWTKATDPNYRENGKNIYEWMLGFSRLP